MGQTVKKICALTMVRNDDFFLRKWVEYYGAQLGREHLYIYFDGTDQTIPSFCDGVHTETLPHTPANVREGDRFRARFLSDRAAELFERYDAVIGTDADEFIIPDPLTGKSLVSFISEVRTRYPAISALGVDVGQNLREEGPVDASMPFLAQRHYAKLSTRYSKASILLKPAGWGSGFHRVRHRNYHIFSNLYLFHFGGFDLGMIKSKMYDTEKTAEGWNRHLLKRAGTVKLASEAAARRWDDVVPVARRIQNIVRPPYAWNKPAMFETKILVEIPERFRNLV